MEENFDKTHHETNYETSPKSNVEIKNIIKNHSNEIYKKIFKRSGISLEINPFVIMKDDIRNYRRLNSFQISYIEKLTEQEKIEIIKLYDTIISDIHLLVYN
jgi:Trk K+ transport system NAD-binding subunit